MLSLHQHRKKFPSEALSYEQIQQILVRSDENLRRDPIYRQPASITAQPSGEMPNPAAAMSELHHRLKELYAMEAPLFVIKGNDFANQLRRVLNLPIRLFGSKQVRFNHEVLETIELLVVQLHLIHQLTITTEDLQRVVKQLEEELTAQAKTIRDLQQQLNQYSDAADQ
jgi:hypothetical protein